MNFQNLDSDPTIKGIVDLIIDDDKFKSKCRESFQKIFEDNKFDKDDIPLVINLILTVYINHKKIKIASKNLKPVFMLLLSKMINELKDDMMLDDKMGLDEKMILVLIEPHIDILLMSVKIPRCKSSCCSSRPETDDNVVNKLKVNKVDKSNMK